MALDREYIHDRLEMSLKYPMWGELSVGTMEQFREGLRDFSQWACGVVSGPIPWITDRLATHISNLSVTSLDIDPARNFDWQRSDLEGFCYRIQALLPNDTLAGYYLGRISDDIYAAFGYQIMKDETAPCSVSNSEPPPAGIRTEEIAQKEPSYKVDSTYSSKSKASGDTSSAVEKMDSKVEIFDVLMDAVCCMACADGKLVKLERLAIHTLLEKENVGWSHAEIEKRINAFVNRIKANGWHQTIEEICAKLPLFSEIHREDVLKRCIDRVMCADGIFHPKEIALCRKLMNSCVRAPAAMPLSPHGPSSQAHSSGTVVIRRTNNGWLLPQEKDVIPVNAKFSDGYTIRGVAEAVHLTDDGCATVLNIGPLQWIGNCPIVLGKQYQAADIFELLWLADVKLEPPSEPADKPATVVKTATSVTEYDNAAKTNTHQEKDEHDDKAPLFQEEDNRGTRHDTERIASMYWLLRVASPKKNPFVLYAFDRAEDAREALLELPCIHVAEDSNKLICTEVLIFGYYKTKRGKYEAIVCGADLSHDLWMQAKKSFIAHGGLPVGKGALEPKTQARRDKTKTRAKRNKKKKARLGDVKFVREDRNNRFGIESIYRIYSGPNAAAAKAFLGQNPVTKRSYYIVVETPEGNYGRDIMGMYTE